MMPLNQAARFRLDDVGFRERQSREEGDLTIHDPRLHAYRSDLADRRLRGKVVADRFVAGIDARIAVPVADMLPAPRAGAGLSTQLLGGGLVEVFDRAGGFAWVQSLDDGYVGYVRESDLAAPESETTHVVQVPRTFLYPDADLRFPITGMLSLGSRVAVTGYAETRGTHYARLASGGAVIERHLRAIDSRADDYVAVAETMLNTPYLWGGVSGFGIDCSGLVQLSMRMAGRVVLRDSDMQAATIGAPLEPGADMDGLMRGDLVFWKGHVAIVTDPETILHASGHTMLVSRENLRQAIGRIGYLYGGPTGFRRP